MSASERILLGALLADNAQLARVKLEQGDFTITAHGQIFSAVKRMVGAGKVCDALTVAEMLESETGRSDWLKLTVDMTRECLTPANALAYAESIRKHSIARKTASIGEYLVSGGDANEAIRQLMALSAIEASWVCHQFDAAQEAIDEMSRATEGALSGVTSGIRDIDEMFGGFHDGDLIVIGARPAMGKTAFMLNLAASADKPVGIISGEQGRAQIGMRLMSINGQLSLHKMRTGGLSNDEWARVSKTMQAMKDRPVWIFDKPAPTIDDVVRQARAWKFDQNIGILMIDYLQKLRGGNGENFRLQVGDIAQQLKDLGRELKIPVVALAQVKREVETRPMGSDGMGRMPHMSDLAESGVIEMEADVIGTLYRPEVYDDSPQYQGLAYFNAGKNRHGPIGQKALSWRGEFLKFGDLAKQEISYHDRWSANG
jgi:replicative DNA helicase